jgi:hypothetical protein
MERWSKPAHPSLMTWSPVINGEDPHDHINATNSLSPLSYFQMAEASLNGTFGAFLIGIIVSSCLFGVACTQTWYYYTRYSDGIVLKALVSFKNPSSHRPRTNRLAGWHYIVTHRYQSNTH